MELLSLQVVRELNRDIFLSLFPSHTTQMLALQRQQQAQAQQRVALPAFTSVPSMTSVVLFDTHTYTHTYTLSLLESMEIISKT